MSDQIARLTTDDDTSVTPLLRLSIVLLVAMIATILIYVVLSLSPVSNGLSKTVSDHMLQSGVSNPVTAVLLNFRGYDTLLEMFVLLVALMVVWSLDVAHFEKDQPPSPLLDALPRFLLPLLILVSAYLLWAGAHAPGGAFQAGSVLGAAGVLLLLAGWRPQAGLVKLPLRLILVIGPGVFVAMALLTLFIEGQMLQYPQAHAGKLILIIEAAATLSIAATLATLFLLGRPQLMENE